MFLFHLSLLLIIIIERFFYTVVTSPLPPYLNSAALSGLLMVIKKKNQQFCNKGYVMSLGFFAPKRSNLTLSAMLTVLPDDIDRITSLVCVFSLTDLIKL